MIELTHIPSERLAVIAEVDDENFTEQELAHLPACTDCFKKWKALFGFDKWEAAAEQ